jgi:hypothetical protein
MAEVDIVGDEGDVVIDSGLRDESIRQLCFVAASQDASSQIASALPVAFFKFEERQRQNKINKAPFNRRAAERLSEYYRRQRRLSGKNC